MIIGDEVASHSLDWVRVGGNAQRVIGITCSYLYDRVMYNIYIYIYIYIYIPSADQMIPKADQARALCDHERTKCDQANTK